MNTPTDTTAEATDPLILDWALAVRDLQQQASLGSLRPEGLTLPHLPRMPAWAKWEEFTATPEGELICTLAGETHGSDGIRAWLEQKTTVVVYPEIDPAARPIGWCSRQPVTTVWDDVRSTVTHQPPRLHAVEAAEPAPSPSTRPGDTELLEAFASYLRSGNRAKRTIKSRVSLLRAFAARQGIQLIDATVFHLRSDIGRDGISPATRQTTRSAFLSFYGFLYAEGLRSDNPALRLPVVKVPPHRPRPYTQEQIDRMLSTGAYRRTRAMILLACYQGLRASEIAAVHADDFDLAAGTQKVLGKGGRTDYLPLHDVIRELVPTMGDSWWFPARGGRDGHIKGQSVSDLLHDARERAGIADKSLTGHSLRHSFGTELVRRGANVRAVQELMRHSSLQTTQRYTQVLDDDRRAALAVLPNRSITTRSGRRRGPGA